MNKHVLLCLKEELSQLRWSWDCYFDAPSYLRETEYIIEELNEQNT